MDQGQVHIYCGDGKGKTTAAVGLAVRASGSSLHVVFAQFLKNNSSSERSILSSVEKITLLNGPEQVKFVRSMNELEYQEARKAFSSLFETCLAYSRSSDTDLLILDEIIGAVGTGIIAESDLISLIRGRAPQVELVLTGRNPSDALVDLADYVTEMKLVKHPFQKGLRARLGIEF